MIDLSKEPFVFKTQTVADLRDQLAQVLPSRAKVVVKNDKPPEIRVSEGLWRGASLTIETTGQQMKLVRICHYIPTFMAKVIIFTISVAVFSIIMMVVVSAVVGEFVPGVFGIGGVAGFAMYSMIKTFIISIIRDSWSPELHQAIEKLTA